MRIKSLTMFDINDIMQTSQQRMKRNNMKFIERDDIAHVTMMLIETFIDDNNETIDHYTMTFTHNDNDYVVHMHNNENMSMCDVSIECNNVTIFISDSFDESCTSNDVDMHYEIVEILNKQHDNANNE